ncbi:MAG: TonB-dependent receptor [Gammaproteobacteria bacterium]|nr:TonB-dependent receptor [Gammaproteobacteria bacterium]
MSHSARSSLRAAIRRSMLMTGLGAVMGVPVYAQQSSGIDEIVVTARQRAELLQDVPASVTAFTAADIADAGITRPEDFIALTPGVTMINSTEAGDLQVNIRGINTSRDAETNFALIVDGVLLTNPNAFNQEFANISQIEIVKGPQGALYGRNAASGAIIITTEQPGNEFEGNVRLGLGNNSTVTASGSVGGPLVADTLYGSLNVAYRDTDGHFRNSFTGNKDVDDYNEKIIGGRLIWDASDDLTVDFKARYSEIDSAAIAFNASFALPVFEGALEPVFGVPGRTFRDVNDHQFIYQNNVVPQNEQENLNLSVKADWDLGFASLTGIAAYNDQEQYFLTDGTSAAFGIYFAEPTCLASLASTANDFYGPNFDALNPFFNFGFPEGSLLPPYSATTCDGYQYQVRNQEDLSFELRLTSPGDQALRWIAGVNYVDIDRTVIVSQGADLNQGFLLQPFVPSTGPNPTDLLYHDDYDSTVWAIFGNIGYDLRDDVELSVALRYDRERRKVANRVPTDAVAPFINPLELDAPPINPALLFADSIPDRSATFTQLQPKISLTWSVNDAFSVYGSYGVGFRSGGFNSQGVEATIEVFYTDAFGARLFNARDDFDKEVSKSFELGFKSTLLERRLQINAAAYHTRVDDMQFFNFFAGPFGLLRVVTNIDEVDLTGVEADFRFRVTNNFTIYGGGSILDSEIKANTNRPFTVGNKVPMAPDYTYNLGAQFTAPLTPGIDLVARADLTGVGKTWFGEVQDGPDNIVPTLFGVPGDFSRQRRDAFELVNARLGVRADNWTATLWARNLLNKEYLQEVIPAPEFGGSFIHDSPRRAYGVEFSYMF